MSTKTEFALQAELQRIDTLKLEGLRAEWRRRWGAPSGQRSAILLRYMLAWRLQAEALGGIDQRTRNGLLSSDPGVAPVHLDPGSRLNREWRGEDHEVEVLPGGFAYRGERYGSLSEIARLITGARWNGLRFFGLRRKGGR